MNEIPQTIPEEFLSLNSSPAYLFDLDAFAERIRRTRGYLKEQVLLCYAIKANPFLTRTAAACADRLEVCSPGELRICERLGVPLEKIVLSGVWKDEDDIRRTVRAWRGSNIFTVESAGQFDLLRRISEEEHCPLRLLIRLSSGNQFGMDEEAVREIIRSRSSYPQLTFLGLQFYSGTQKKAASLEKELGHLDEFLGELYRDFGYRAEELEYGPGLFVPYFQKDASVPEQELLAYVSDLLGSLSFSGTITLEMGRYLAAPCGYYLTSVRDIKRTRGQNYAILDGGIHHLNYYGQTMAMKQPFFYYLPKNGQPAKDILDYQLCGALCTAGDVLLRRAALPHLHCGDRLLFCRAGAYTVTEGIYLFLSRDLPQVYFWTAAHGLVLARGADPTDVLNAPRDSSVY